MSPSQQSESARPLPNSDAQRTMLRPAGGGDTSAEPSHCLTAALEISGPAEPELIHERLCAVVARRPALRAAFLSEAYHQPAECGQPVLNTRVVQGGSSDEPWRLVHELAREEAHRPFPEHAVPRLRGTLLTAAADRHLLVIGVDPRVCDAWSANLIVAELLAEAGASAPDDYERVWRARAAWLAGDAGEAAVARRGAAVAGALRYWPPARPEAARANRPGHPGARTERVVDLDDATAGALLERVQRVRGTVLAAGAQALALSACGRLGTPLALTTTLAARQPEEEATVGRLAEDGVLVVPPREGTVAGHLRAIRGAVFGALTDQQVPYERLLPALDASGADSGLSYSLLFLPGALSGGQEAVQRFGGARVARAAVSICATGADLDLFLVERPPPRGDGARPLLRAGVLSSGTVSPEQAEETLARWIEALRRLAQCDWAETEVAELAAGLEHAAGATSPTGTLP